MKKPVIFPALFFLALLFCRDLSAQNLSDSSFFQKSLSAARAQYMKNIGASSYLYNGVAYNHYWNGVKGSPLFMTEEFRNGTLYYDGTIYEDVPLLYDMYHDEVISKTFDRNVDLKLLGEKIHSFSIGPYFFVRIDADSLSGSPLTTGFYQRLYKGNITVLEKRQNRIVNALKVDENFTKFAEFDHYYVEKDGRYHTIEGESDLQSLFKDQKALIRKFLNRHDINYKKDPANTIVQTVAYYEQLKK
jgi:hypothetical protein